MLVYTSVAGVLAGAAGVAPVSSALLWRNAPIAELTGHGKPRVLRHEAPFQLPNAEHRLHRIANRAIKRGLNLDALECYSLAVSSLQTCSGRSFLLLALHLQRINEFDLARSAFAEGVVLHRTDARLMQAWGLFESKHGRLDRAKRLLKRAVSLDESLSAVLRWKMFREPAPARPEEPSNLRRSPGVSKAVRARRVYALQFPEGDDNQPTGAGAHESDATAPAAKAMLHPRPSIRYAIPSLVPGWRGRPENGEDPSCWYDAEGLRNGPPRNYWRQSLDERLYREDMSLVEAILRDETDEANELIVELQKRGKKVRTPSLNRKLLGRWAPLMCKGAAVATSATEQKISSPSTLDIRRAAGSKLISDRLGEREEHLAEGERLLLTQRWIDDAAGATIDTWEAEASADNQRQPPLSSSTNGSERSSEQMPAAMFLTTITYLSEYLLLQCDEDGAIDVWMRVPQLE